ncbi:MAG: LamG domain-containing protein, partial [Planctomycetota bacterium]
MKAKMIIVAVLGLCALSGSAFTGQTIFLEAAYGSYASAEFPADGEVITGDIAGANIWTKLIFVPGATAVKHTGYFSEDYSKVESRAQDANLGDPPYASVPGWEYTFFAGNPAVGPADDTLVRSTKYYWCVDETDAMGTTFPGEIWEFAIQDYKACCPNPPDGAVVSGPDVLLSWVPGFGVDEHDVYFGTSWDDVNNAVYDYANPPQEFLGNIPESNILVTGLSDNTTYYWRVDEVSHRLPPPLGGGTYYKGDVWSFTVIDGKAQADFPTDGAVIPGEIMTYLGDEYIWTRLTFIPGAAAVKHTGYFSNNYDDVANRIEDANLSSYGPYLPAYIPGLEYTFYVGNPQVPPAVETLVRGTKYYWTVDETDSLGTTYPGDIWEFTIQDFQACCPNPPDGDVGLGPDVLLSWLPGFGVEEHDVYMGTSWEDVNNARYNFLNPPPEYLGFVTEPNILVTGLSENTMYYWRVDEIYGRLPPPIGGGTYYAGDVWSFKTKTAGPMELIAHFKFDEGSGVTAYDSAGDNDGTVNGATWTTGQINGALSFDDVDDYVEVPDDPSLRFTQYDSFTVSFWAKPSTGGYIFSKLHSNSQHGIFGYALRWLETSEEFQFMTQDSGSVNVFVDTTDNSAPADSWYSVTAIYDKKDMELYLNAELKGTGFFGYDTGSTSPDNKFTIGVRLFDTTLEQYFGGLIDEVRVYNRALSAGEVEQLYHQGRFKAFAPYPPDGTTGIDPNVVLGWTPGLDALSHDVYFGTSFDDVNDADTLSDEYMGNYDVNSYDPCGLNLDTTYYWRVDEVVDSNIVKGDVWSFKTRAEFSSHLVAWWMFDEGEGSIAYDSAGTNDGTVNGATWTTGQVNGALSFDGSNDYVSVPHDPALNITGDITISVWLYLNEGALYETIVSKCVSSGSENVPYDFRSTLSKLTLVRADASGHERIYSLPRIPLGQWHHCLVRVENKVPDFY